MSETFAGRAITLAPLAMRELAWPPDSFWNATPADLALALGEPGRADTPLTREEIAKLIELEREND